MFKSPSVDLQAHVAQSTTTTIPPETDQATGQPQYTGLTQIMSDLLGIMPTTNSGFTSAFAGQKNEKANEHQNEIEIENGKQKFYFMPVADWSLLASMAIENTDRMARGKPCKPLVVVDEEMAHMLREKGPLLMAREIESLYRTKPELCPDLFRNLPELVRVACLQEQLREVLPVIFQDLTHAAGPLGSATHVEIPAHGGAGSSDLEFHPWQGDDKKIKFSVDEIAELLAMSGIPRNAELKISSCESAVGKPASALSPAALREAIRGDRGEQSFCEQLGGLLSQRIDHQGPITGYGADLSAGHSRHVLEVATPGEPHARQAEYAADKARITFRPNEQPALYESPAALAEVLQRKRDKRQMQFDQAQSRST
ncbi:MAG: hypothetical protein EOO28_08155 [Comamonadaceae bacterium]|nr:MAG: hypothetical protein EOO28_08155 [Comamonadaceae bacterium]